MKGIKTKTIKFENIKLENKEASVLFHAMELNYEEGLRIHLNNQHGNVKSLIGRKVFDGWIFDEIMFEIEDKEVDDKTKLKELEDKFIKCENKIIYMNNKFNDDIITLAKNQIGMNQQGLCVKVDDLNRKLISQFDAIKNINANIEKIFNNISSIEDDIEDLED